MSIGKAKKPSPPPNAWDAAAVLARINKARGDYLSRTGRDMEWGDLGRAMGWKPPTVTEVKQGRTLRVAEIARMAAILEVTPGWLAFGQGPETPEELTLALAMLATTRPRPAG